MGKVKKVKDWGQIAKDYDSNGEFVVGKEVILEKANKLSKEKNLGTVLEFACGTGFFTKIVAVNADKVIATDISNDMLKVAKTNLIDYENVEFKQVDSKKTNFVDKSFDTVVMVNLLHVVKGIDEVLAESYRLLKSGGRLIAIDLTTNGMKKLEAVKLLLRYLRRIGKPPKAEKGSLSPELLQRFVEKAGFETQECVLLGAKVKAVYYRGKK